MACAFISVSVFTPWRSCVCVHVCALATTVTSHLKSRAKLIRHHMQGGEGGSNQTHRGRDQSQGAPELCTLAQRLPSTSRPVAALRQTAMRHRDATEAERPHPSGPPPRRNLSSSNGTSSCFLPLLPYHRRNLCRTSVFKYLILFPVHTASLTSELPPFCWISTIYWTSSLSSCLFK